MRAGPLSNPEVISLLNRYFVPVFVSNEDYRSQGPAPLEERAERDRIFREARQAGLSTGTVHAYVLSPDGQVIDSLHVVEAAKVERTREMLSKTVARFDTEPGEPVLAAACQSSPPDAPPGGVVLHLVARYLRQDQGSLVPLAEEAGLGKTRNAAWQAYPAENWIVLSGEEAASLLPQRTAKKSDSWQIERATAQRLLIHLYPSTECNDVRRNRIDRLELTATVESVEKGAVRVVLRGSLKMKHNFYPGREDQNFVETDLAGYFDFEPDTRRIRRLRLATENARYAGMPFGAALSSTDG